ncbi:hypothetical protein QYE76_036445 [Lolium multiflorum]|uniref:F-box domain-containing protein n=1 Tax=Lolium multiflorum TaxID=4521 RepID=A0AAD8R1Z5_LOLMU|nr:hypothetical protein QYE76_036445 [Lolium multiflorum]
MPNPADRSPPSEEGCTSTLVRCSSSGAVTAAERLTDDFIVEILSRVPTKSLCRFKCVSKHWLSLTTDRKHCKKLPQTLVGVFYSRPSGDGFKESFVQFTSATPRFGSPICTSLAFLPNHRRAILLDGCNGLLLVLWCPNAQGPECYYVVCNPATEKWVALPDPKQVNKEDVLHLGLSFDPDVSSHFHVFAFLKEKDGCEWDPYWSGVEVYSSETGTWVYKDNCWNGDIMLANHQSASVFLNGYMHLHAFHREPYRCLAVVDTKGETATHFRVPGGIYQGFIQKSQGCLHYANFQRTEGTAVIRFVVYVLKDYGSKEWTLKHSSATSYIFGKNLAYLHPHFEWIMIHPDCNLIFFTVGHGIWCYNMDRRQVELIPGTEYCMGPYLPYVPLYSELPSLHE